MNIRAFQRFYLLLACFACFATSIEESGSHACGCHGAPPSRASAILLASRSSFLVNVMMTMRTNQKIYALHPHLAGHHMHEEHNTSSACNFPGINRACSRSSSSMISTGLSMHSFRRAFSIFFLGYLKYTKHGMRTRKTVPYCGLGGPHTKQCLHRARRLLLSFGRCCCRQRHLACQSESQSQTVKLQTRSIVEGPLAQISTLL